MRTRLIALPAVAATLLLAACGGASEEAVVPTSIPPLVRATADVTAPASTPERTSGLTTSTVPTTRSKASTQAQGDQPASEITALPAKDEYNELDRNFFDTLREKGINSEGVEDQLLATAALICQAKTTGEEVFALPAIAGQLAEQGHTTLDLAQAQDTLRAEAVRVYCP